MHLKHSITLFSYSVLSLCSLSLPLSPLSLPLPPSLTPKKGTEVTLKFRALKPPETTNDAEYRIHKRLQREGWTTPTESMIQKIIDRLIVFTKDKTSYKVPGNQPRRRPTVAQTLVGSAARAIFIQYDADKSGVREILDIIDLLLHYILLTRYYSCFFLFSFFF